MINCRFEIISYIGKGRSEVYLCRDMDFDNREVAVKFLLPEVSNEEKKAFRDEFFMLGKLDHPNIIKALEIGEVVRIDQNDPVKIGSKFILLEYFESTKLFDYKFIKVERKLREVLKQVCSVLYYLHQSNYIYYDLKPENILVSLNSELPQIKLIDLGLAEFIPDRDGHIIKGTAQYIAPELLKKEVHDHRVDLYSFGIMLYEIIYDRLPFPDGDELKIYKAKVEEEFSFPDSVQFGPELIEITKKLLEKDPEKRYRNSLEIINDLGFEIDPTVFHNFVPAKVLSGRQDFTNILNAYVNDKNSSEVFTLKGFDGAGKSSLINQMYEALPNSILISNMQGITGIDLIKHMIKRMIFSPGVFLKLNNEEKKQVLLFIEKANKDYLEGLPPIISTITGKSQFVVLIDDYNLYDSFARGVISDLIPIFQVNGSKVIISEASDFDYASNQINNLRELLVGSFTEKQLIEFINLAFYNSFPRESLKDLLLSFADLLPGNIIDFIQDLVNLQIIVFGPEGASVNENLERIAGLEDSLSGIYDLRLSNLTEEEFNVAKVISAFEGGIEQNALLKLLKINHAELNKIFINLQFNNVIHPFTISSVPVIVSDGLKKHIYSLIEDNKTFHSHLAKIIDESLPDYNRSELARQFELAGNYERAFSVWIEEINHAEELAAFAYIRNILQHLTSLPISENTKNEVNYRLVETLYKLGDYNSALQITEQVNLELLPKEKDLELYIVKGSSLINVGKLEEGMELLNSLLPKVVDEYRRSKLLVEIAYAKFDLNYFLEAMEMCRKTLERANVKDEDLGRIHNLLGLCSIFQDQNTEVSLKEFNKSLEYYEKAKLTLKVAAIEVNIGNIYNLHGDTNNAEIHWKRALNLNLSIGNLDQEGVLLLNNGIYFFNKAHFDECVEYYNRAHRIFLSLGNLKNQGLALSNLGEAYLSICEYQKAFDVLNEARSIFEEMDNIEELIPVYHLLGLFYFTVGDKELLSGLYRSTISLLDNSNFKEKFNNEIQFLKSLHLISSGMEIEIGEFEAVRDYYLKQEDLKNYVVVNAILLNYLIKLKLFPKADEELTKPAFIEVCESNNIYKANREYLLGKLSSVYDTKNNLSPIEHFEKAYELLSDESITELTWKVLYALSITYAERGNYNKAKKFIIYARDLINLIAENIGTTQIKSVYLQTDERQKALVKLEELYLS